MFYYQLIFIFLTSANLAQSDIWPETINKKTFSKIVNDIGKNRFEASPKMSVLEGNVNPPEPVVEIVQGTVVGRLDTSEQGQIFKSFQRIPYGKVEKRFSRAVQADKFDNGFFSAKQEGPQCPQLTGSYPVTGGMSEDCLSVNVFVPIEGENLPVMVWIHGGAYVRGSGGDYYYGPQFFMDYGVILVTLNYRLGQFGFLSLETDEVSGNMALWDQHLALDWVNRNIQYFGGDKSRITIFGESAGSFSVMYHLVSPKSSEMFSAAIAQSGAPFSTFYGPQSPGHARRVAIDLAASLGCETYADDIIMTCLRNKTYEEILNQQIFCDECNQHLSCVGQQDHICTVAAWNAVMDGAFSTDPFLPDSPANIVEGENHNKVPLIIGINSEEGIYSSAKYIKDNKMFAEINDDWDVYGPLYLFDKADNVSDIEQEVSALVRSFYLGDDEASMENIHSVIDLFSDNIFWSGTHHFTKLAVGRQTSPIYQYLLTYKATNSFADLALGIDSESLGLGVCHADDLYHLFKNHVHDMTFSEEDLEVRQKMLTWWTNFAKYHEPDEEGVWQKVETNNHQYLNISSEPHMEYSEKYANRMDFWMDILEKVHSL